MTRRLAVALAVAALAVLAVPAAGSAHNVRVSPRIGTFGDDFVFYGTFWQKLHRVRWFYDQHADGEFDQTGRFFTGTKGRFAFRWRGEDVFDTHRMCFRQFDSRFQKTYFKCKRFTLLPD
jgi:hypothetical protein